MTGRLWRGLAFAITVMSMGWMGMTLGTASAEERRLLMPFPAGASPVEREPDRMDPFRAAKMDSSTATVTPPAAPSP